MGFDKGYAKYVDHTVLKMPTTLATVKRFCDEAREYGFAGVCVNPCNIAFVAEQLAGTDVKPCAVIGFPLGANTTKIKALEARDAIDNGAREVDMVINVGMLKAKEYTYVRNEIKEIKEALLENTKALNTLNQTLNEERVNNTKAINELTTLLHEEKLRVELMNERESTDISLRNTIVTGLIVGLGLLIDEGLLRIL